MRIFISLFVFFIFSMPATAQYHYRRFGAPMAIAPQYQAAPAQDDCPQGREIRAQKSYPTSMTDCQVLDADTAAQNNQIRQRRVVESSPPVAPAMQPAPPAPRTLNQEQIRRLLDQHNEASAVPGESALVSDSPSVESNPSIRTVAAPIYATNLKDPTGQKGDGWIWVFLVAGLSLYFTPALIAANRGHHNALAIFALDLFLGWSFLGWVVAFVWACTRVEKRSALDRGDVLVTRREPAL